MRTQALICQQEIPPPTEWGWEESENGWVPKWTDLPEASAACQELIHCSCKKSCQGAAQSFVPVQDIVADKTFNFIRNDIVMCK